MGKKLKSVHFLLIILLFNATGFTQVGIGTTSVHSSAKLQVDANDKGFLPPRMSTTARDAISSPLAGLVIFNTTTNGLEVFSNGVWNKLSFAGANSDITAMSGLTSQKLIKTITGPINLSSYSPGDVVYEQSTGLYYFFKQPSSQSSLAFNNTNQNLAIFDFGRVVIRIRSNVTAQIASITLKLPSNVSDLVISLYSGLSPCAPSCTWSGNVATVNETTLLGSSAPVSGNGDVTFTFSTPVSVTGNTDYYLTFSSSCVPGLNIAVSGGAGGVTDTNFAISYGSCEINQGVPSVRINYVGGATTL